MYICLTAHLTSIDESGQVNETIVALFTLPSLAPPPSPSGNWNFTGGGNGSSQGTNLGERRRKKREETSGRQRTAQEHLFRD